MTPITFHAKKHSIVLILLFAFSLNAYATTYGYYSGELAVGNAALYYGNTNQTSVYCTPPTTQNRHNVYLSELDTTFDNKMQQCSNGDISFLVNPPSMLCAADGIYWFDYNAFNYPPASACYEEPPVICTDGEVIDSGYYESATPIDTACFNTCVGNLIGSPSSQVIDGVLIDGWIGTYTANGDTCTTEPDGTAGTAEPVFSCGTNQVETTIGSQTYCVDTVTGDIVGIIDPTESIPTSETDTTTINNVDNGDGTTTKTTTINHDGGGTTTTIETIDNGTGEPTGSTTTVEGTASAGEFLNQICQENPTATICIETIYGDSTNCLIPPSCEGDAIQCAIAINTWKTNCNTKKDGIFNELDFGTESQIQSEVNSYVANEKAAIGDFTNLLTGGDNNEETDLAAIVDLSSYDTHTGSCPTVPPMVIHGASIPLQPVIEPFCEVANIIAFLSNFVAGFIILFSISRGLQ